MKSPSLAPLDREPYKPNLRMRQASERAAAAEPKIGTMTSAVKPRGKWEYDPKRPA